MSKKKEGTDKHRLYHFSISIGQTRKSVKDVAKMKARRSAGCTTTRVGRKSEARTERKEMGAKNNNIKELLEVARRNHNPSFG